MANRIAYHEMRRNIRLNAHQRAILVGTLLGDGSLIETSSKNNLRLSINHSVAQKEYVFWKYEALKPLILTPPQYQAINNSWRFRTISHPELTDLGKLFYQGRRKIVPLEITSLLSPIGLAVWFMDDGARLGNRGYILNTQCFTQNEVALLRDCLAKKFSISETSTHRDHNGWRIYIKKGNFERFRQLIRSYILPDLLYKLESPVETTRRLPVLSPG